MASLPERERLSLSAAAELMAAETSCEAVAARQALAGGLQDGSIRATGINDDEELYVPARYWHREIDWTASKLLDWEHIKLSRADLMKWLGQALEGMPAAQRETKTEYPPTHSTEPAMPVLKDQFNKLYQDWVTEFQSKGLGLPTMADDLAWGQEKGIGRDRIRKLRKDNRPDEAKKGGAPKQNLAGKLGGK